MGGRLSRVVVLGTGLWAACTSNEDLTGIRFRCATDADCADGYACTGAVCTLPGVVDAGPADAGALDAGVADGGAGALDAGPPGQLTFSTEPSASAVAGAPLATQPQVEVLDLNGVPLSSATNAVSLLPFSDAACAVPAPANFTAAANPVSALGGVASFSGVTWTGAGTLYLKASALGLAPACSSPISVSPGAVGKLAIAGPNTIGVAQCSPAFTVTTQDALGNPAAVSGAPQIIAVSGSGSAKLYADPGCATVAATISVGTGSSSQVFYVEDAVAETVSLTASSSPLMGATWPLTTTTFSAVAMGSGRGYAILGGGLVETWGNVFFGPVADGGILPSPHPVNTWGIPAGATSVSAGGNFGCGIVNAAAKCWGQGTLGEMGNGANGDNYPVPVQVNGLSTGVTAISAGYQHACAVMNGAAFCWGDNPDGELGDGTTTASNVPVPVSGLDAGIVDIAAGYNHSCAVSSTGAVLCWGGDPYFGELGGGGAGPKLSPVRSNIDAGATRVVAGNEFSCALMANGTIECWGRGDQGQLGNGTTATLPGPVKGITAGATTVSTQSEAFRVCAVVSGAAWCWGAFDLGNGTTSESNVPVAVSGLDAGVSAIGAGPSASCAIVNGSVACWGNQLDGSIGNGAGVDRLGPVAVQGLNRGAAAISVGDAHSCAVVDGGVWCWGSNYLGQLGTGRAGPVSSTPVPVLGLGTGATAVAAGQKASACAVQDGGVQCWGGYNSFGELGRGGGASNTNVPAPVVGLDAGVTAIGGGYGFYCALAGGAVECWGYNGYGQLGNASNSSSDVPVPVQGLTSGVTELSTGYNHVCAVQNGAAWCWGNGLLGRLGNGGTANSTIPVPVTGLSTGVTSIFAGGSHTCAIAGGGVFCWGDDGDGELGSGATNQGTSVPSAVPALSGATALATGGGFTCGLFGGAASCWGGSRFSVQFYHPAAVGQLGNGANQLSASPLPVSGLSAGVLQLAASTGGAHACAILDFGNVQCWGADESGQLGDGTSVDLTVPALIGTW